MSAGEAQKAVTVRQFVQRFSSTPRGARLARRLAVHRMDRWGMAYGSEGSDAIALIVSELAANAVRHGRVPGRDFELRLTQDRATRVVWVEVSNTRPALPRLPAPDGTAWEEERGRDLLLVAATACRWGVSERVGPGKTVWAEYGGVPNVRRRAGETA